MTRSQAATTIPNQLTSLDQQIHEEDFDMPSEIPNTSTTGKHLRHNLIPSPDDGK